MLTRELVNILTINPLEQEPAELDWLDQFVNGSGSILEIGSRLGHTLARMASVCLPGAKVRSIDKPNLECNLADLRRTIAVLNEAGFDADLFVGDSASPEAVAWAQREGPYDFLFIDGDHTYEGVKSDWDKYRRMAKRIGFHDINDPPLGVQQLWCEIKAQGYWTTQIIHRPQPDLYGIGIVDMTRTPT